MKASELVEIVSSYIYNTHTPSESGVRLGCECGCGGDYYMNNIDVWEAEHEIVYKARADMQKLLEDLQIEIDIDTSISETERSTNG